MIELLLKTGGLDVPWPVQLPGGAEIEGRLGINTICKTKCKSHPCRAEQSTLIGTKCHLGLTVYEGRVDDCSVRVFGVMGPQHRDDLPRHADFKQACKGRSVTAQDFANWIAKLKAINKSIRQVQDEHMAEALEPLHDAMRLARDVGQLADQLLIENTPEGLDRFNAATPVHRALIKTSSLLVDTFDLLEVYLNPDAAAFGQPRSVEIYKLLDKLTRIAGLARAHEHRPAVRLIGSTRRAYDVYESYKLIPFILIDNAQKYSRQGGAVTVQIIESGTSLEVSVSSEGALLSSEEQQLIFERGYRGVAARRVHPGGMGLGLYIAKTVARAHGFRIQVASTPDGFELGGIPQAHNTFSFVMRDVQPAASYRA
ncbi:MAG: ATP-binding protein [Thiobacillus sp.]